MRSMASDRHDRTLASPQVPFSSHILVAFPIVQSIQINTGEHDNSTIPIVSTPPGHGWVLVVPFFALGHVMPHTLSGP